METLQEKLKGLFNSTTKQNIRMAQILCHELRISYYILLWDVAPSRQLFFRLNEEDAHVKISYGTMGIADITFTIDNQDPSGEWKIYKINLDGTKRKDF